MPVQFPEHTRPYHLEEIKQYITDNGYGAVLSAAAIEDVITKMKMDYEDPGSYDNPDEALDNPCNRCNSRGWYPLSNDTRIPADASIQKHCPTCDGKGKTVEPVTPAYVVWEDPVT